jgi:hypothetical protein
MQNKIPNSQPNNKPFKYIPIRLIGEGTFGKAYLVKCTEDQVS